MAATRQLLKNVVSLFILQGAGYVLPLVTFPYLVHVLGATKYGVLVLAMALAQYFVILTDYGFFYTAPRQLALAKRDRGAVSRIFTSVLLVKTFLLIISAVLYFSLVFTVPFLRQELSVYAWTFLMVVGSTYFPLWLFQGLERMGELTVIQIGSRLLSTAGIFLLVRGEADYTLAALLQAFAYLLAAVAGLAVAFTRLKVRFSWSLPIRGVLRRELTEGRQVFVSTLSGNVYGQGAVLLTGWFAGATASGYYSIAQKISEAFTSLAQPVAQGLYPHLCRLAENGDIAFYRLRKRIIGIGFLLSVVLMLVISIYSRELVRLVAGEWLIEPARLLVFLAFALVFIVQNILLNPFILALNKDAEMQRMYMTSAVVFLCTAIPAAWLHGGYGMAGCIGVIELLIFLRSIRMTREGSQWRKSA